MAITAVEVVNVGRAAKPRSAPGPWLIRWSDGTETWCKTKEQAMRIAYGETKGFGGLVPEAENGTGTLK